MSRIKRILSSAVCLSLALSVLVNPSLAEADGACVNILEKLELNYTFKSGTKGLTLQSGVTATPCTTDGSDDSYSALIKGFGTINSNTARFTGITVEPGKKYRVTIDAKLASAPPSGTVIGSKVKIAYQGGDPSGAKTSNDDCVPLSADEWTTLSFEFTAADGKSAIHIGPRFDTAFEPGVYIDNYTLTEVLPDIGVVSTSPSNGAEGVVAADTVISVTFDREVDALKPSNFVVNGVTVTNVSTTDNKTYTLTTSPLSNLSTYMVVVINVTAQGCNTLTSYSVTFDTNDGTVVIPPTQEQDAPNANMGENLLAKAGFNCNLESTDAEVILDPVFDTADTYYQSVKTKWDGTVSYELSEDMDAPDGTDSKGALLISGRSADNSSRRVAYAALMPGKAYRASVWIMLKDKNAEAEAAIDLGNAGASKTNQTGYSPETFTVNGYVWTKVYKDFTVKLKDESDEGRGYFHFGYKTPGYKGDLYVDGFSLCEIKPDVLTVQSVSPSDGTKEAELDTQLLLRFSSKVPVSGFTKENVQIDNGAQTGSVTRINDVQYKIAFNKLAGDTLYTVRLKNVKSMTGATLNEYTTTFTTKPAEPQTSVFDEVNFDDGSMLPFSPGGGTCASSTPRHWRASSDDSHSGEYSLYNPGCNCGGQGVYKDIPLEPNEDYVLTFWAKFNGEIVVIPRAQGVYEDYGESVDANGSKLFSNPPYITTARLKGTGGWKQYTVSFTSSITKNNITYGNDTLYLRIDAPSVPVYFDDFVLYKAMPEMDITVSSPSDGGVDVDVQTESIKLVFTNEINKWLSFDEKTEDYISINNGAAITSISRGSDNLSLTATLAEPLEPDTLYTVTVKNIIDIVGQTMPEKTIVFRTELPIKILSEPVIAQSGTTVTGITASVQNRTSSPVKRPVLLYTVHSGGLMNDVGSTELNTSIERAFATEKLEITDTVDVSDDKNINVYILTSFDDISILSQGDCGIKEKSVSVDGQNKRMTVSGTAASGKEISVMVLRPQSSEKNAQNVSGYKAGGKRTLDVSELGGAEICADSLKDYVVDFVTVVADENGDFSVTLPAETVSDSTVYGVILSGEGFAESAALAVYMPAQDELESATEAINSARSTDEMKLAVDAYGAALGLNTISDIYTAEGYNIAKAFYAMRPTAGYFDFTSGAESSAVAIFEKISDYYTLQRTVLEKLNANNTSNDMITSILKESTQVLGAYESSYKLDYSLKYNKYGEYAVNQKLISGRPYASMDDFIKVFNSIEITTVPQQSSSSPGGSNGGGITGGSVPVTPEIKVDGLSDKATFSDLETVQWAEEAIEKLAQRGIVNGVGDGLFMPDKSVTREEFAKMLVMSFDFIIDNSSSRLFDDVPADAWYAPYVYTLCNYGIINGISSTEFGTGQPVSRQDMVTMLYRIIKKLGEIPDGNASINFSDYAQISDYAQEAVDTLTACGMINGITESEFRPRQMATRAQVAVIVNRLFESYIDIYME